MDSVTAQVLKLIDSQHKIKKFLTISCYLLIVGGVFVYVFYGFRKSNAIKLVKDRAESLKEYKTEKIMTNPRIKIQHEDGNIYDIRAKKALHENEQEMIMYDVFAEGKIGNITAGELEITESGDHMVFTKNPVLILNQTE
jgi:hypothetical protein